MSKKRSTAKEQVPNVTELNNVSENGERPRSKLDVLKGLGAAALVPAIVAAGVGVLAAVEKDPVPVTQDISSQSPEVQLAAIEKILTGGNADPTSRGVLDYLASQGMINWAENNYLVAYPADITRGDEGLGVAQEQIMNEYYGAHSRGDHTIMVSFSWGTVPQARAATEIARANGGVLPDDLTVVSYGAPAYGFAESTYGRIAAPFAGLGGIHYGDKPPAGSYDVGSANDFWASSAHDDWLGEIAKASAIPQAHRIPRPDEPRIYWDTPDGVHHERTDVGVHPWTMVATANGLYMNDGYNQFFNCIVPVSNGRDPAPEASARCAIDGLAKAWDEQTGSGHAFQDFMQFVPAFPFQIVSDVVHKVPDFFVDGAANILSPRPEDNLFAPQPANTVPPSVANAPAQTWDQGVEKVADSLRSKGPNAEGWNTMIDNIADNVKTWDNPAPAPVASEAQAPATPAPVEVAPPAPVVPTPAEQWDQGVDAAANSIKGKGPEAEEWNNAVDHIADSVKDWVNPAPAPAPIPVPVEVAPPPPPAPAPVPVEVAPPPAPQTLEQAWNNTVNQVNTFVNGLFPPPAH